MSSIVRQMNFIKHFAILFLLSVCFNISVFADPQASTSPSRNLTFSGKVIDSETGEVVPYAAVAINGGGTGTLADDEGQFSVHVPGFRQGKEKLVVSFLGYTTRSILLDKNHTTNLVIKLHPQTQMLNEIVVTKKRYHNKNNPAVELIQKVIANKDKNKAVQSPFSGQKKYEKVVFSLNDITPEFKQKKAFQQFQFIFDHTDTTKLKGKEILPMYINETYSDKYTRLSPETQKEIPLAQKMVTVNGYDVDNEGLSNFMHYMYQDINIYDHSVMFLTNSFLSPVASDAPAFYRYYIMDTTMVDNERCVKLFFAARNKTDMLFTGNLYISLDGSYGIKRVEMSIDQHANINWVRSVQIDQKFDKGLSGWALSSDGLVIDFGVTKGTVGVVGERKVMYKPMLMASNFTSSQQDSIFKINNSKTDSLEIKRSDSYWDNVRLEPLSNSEAATYQMIDSLQQVPIIKHTMTLGRIFISGFIDFGKFDFGPFYSLVSYNPVEGVRTRVGGRTTELLSKRFITEGYLAYGFKDEKFKYYLGTTFSFTNRTIYRFPVKSLKISYQNDMYRPGQDLRYLYENSMLMSVSRTPNYKVYYDKAFTVEHLNEFYNHISYTLGFRYLLMEPGGDLCFNKTDYNLHTNDVSNINGSEIYGALRYAPGEKFYQGRGGRHSVPSNYPVLELQGRFGSKAWGNDYNYQWLQFDIKQHINFQVLGYMDLQLNTGKIFGDVSYPLLMAHPSNQSFLYDPDAFNLMNYLEFVSDRYVSIYADYCLNGFLLNKIPILRKFKLREAICGRVLFGDLSNRNNPDNNSSLYKFPVSSSGSLTTFSLDSKPYIEASIGICNILKCIRVDLIKRFTYLNNPDVAEYGIRSRIDFDF